MSLVYFDCVGGASGDMVLGALLDAGAPEAVLRDAVAALGIQGATIEVSKVRRSGIGATRVEISGPAEGPWRAWPEVRDLICGASLDGSVKGRALEILRRLAEAEAEVHEVSIEEVRFHEIGAVDTLVDAVGTAALLEALGVTEAVGSSLPVGRGTVESSHGPLPLPAPATLSLLRGIPVVGRDVEVETVTPTGAAILVATCAGFGPIPDMRVERVGYGAGVRLEPAPNLLRVLIGDRETVTDLSADVAVLLETNLDDANPEWLPYVSERCFAGGASDVWLAPIIGKQGRPAVCLSVLCPPERAGALRDLLLTETSTLGLRESRVAKWALEREHLEVEVAGRRVGVKIGRKGDAVANVAPEYADCARAAASTRLPLKEVYARAQAAALAHLSPSARPGSPQR
ncbi:MAG: nickel pincer cofactor biosynthesis protein LarC [Actinomycetota bacterium]